MEVEDNIPVASDTREEIDSDSKKPMAEQRITFTNWQLENPDFTRIPKSLLPKNVKAGKPTKHVKADEGLSEVDKRRDPFPGKKPLSEEEKGKAKLFDRGGFYRPKEFWHSGGIVEKKKFIQKEKRRKMVSEEVVRADVLLTEDHGYAQKNFLLSCFNGILRI